MPKRMTKAEKAAFAAGCRTGARKQKQLCGCRTRTAKRSRAY